LFSGVSPDVTSDNCFESEKCNCLSSRESLLLQQENKLISKTSFCNDYLLPGHFCKFQQQHFFPFHHLFRCWSTSPSIIVPLFEESRRIFLMDLPQCSKLLSHILKGRHDLIIRGKIFAVSIINFVMVCSFFPDIDFICHFEKKNRR